jgi:hypothetical protein
MVDVVEVSADVGLVEMPHFLADQPGNQITRLNRFTCVTARTSLGLRLAHVVTSMSPRLDSRWSGSFPLPGRESHPLEAPGLPWRTEVALDVSLYDVRHRTTTYRATDGAERVVRAEARPEAVGTREKILLAIAVSTVTVAFGRSCLPEPGSRSVDRFRSPSGYRPSAAAERGSGDSRGDGGALGCSAICSARTPGT